MSLDQQVSLFGDALDLMTYGTEFATLSSCGRKVSSALPVQLQSYSEDDLQDPEISPLNHKESASALQKQALYLQRDPCLWQDGLQGRSKEEHPIPHFKDHSLHQLHNQPSEDQI